MLGVLLQKMGDFFSLKIWSDKPLPFAGRNFKLHGLRPNHDIDPSGTRIHLGTSGAAVHIVDSETSAIRDTSLNDLYDMARLAHVLPNIHMFQRTVVARDVLDPHEMDLNTAYACLKVHQNLQDHLLVVWPQWKMPLR